MLTCQLNASEKFTGGEEGIHGKNLCNKPQVATTNPALEQLVVHILKRNRPILHILRNSNPMRHITQLIPPKPVTKACTFHDHDPQPISIARQHPNAQHLCDGRIMVEQYRLASYFGSVMISRLIGLLRPRPGQPKHDLLVILESSCAKQGRLSVQFALQASTSL